MHPDLPDTAAAALERYAAEGPPERYRQPGVGGLPVFRERLALRGTGKRGAARLTVYCDAERVVALRPCTKSAVGVLPRGAIQEALDAIDPPPPSTRTSDE